MFWPFKKKTKYQYSTTLLLQLIDLINRVKFYISDDSDMTYCYYETPSDFIKELDRIIDDIQDGNLKAIDDIAVEFAPTSSIQEHSMGNGWSNDYLIISKEFDSVQRLLTR